MIVRHLTPADVGAVVALQQECVGAPQWSLAVWERLAVGGVDATPVRHAFVMQEARRTVGFAVVSQTFEDCEVETLAVAPALRQRGMGRALLRHALDAATQAGARRAHLEVRASNAAAQALYHSLGFQVAGRRTDYYRAPAEDAILLSAALPLRLSQAKV